MQSYRPFHTSPCNTYRRLPLRYGPALTYSIHRPVTLTGDEMCCDISRYGPALHYSIHRLYKLTGDSRWDVLWHQPVWSSPPLLHISPVHTYRRLPFRCVVRSAGMVQPSPTPYIACTHLPETPVEMCCDISRYGPALPYSIHRLYTLTGDSRWDVLWHQPVWSCPPLLNTSPVHTYRRLPLRCVVPSAGMVQPSPTPYIACIIYV